MTNTPDEFFIPDNEVRLTEELDYGRVDEYVRSAEAFSRSSYQSVYIIDYFKQNFLYVSPNPMFLCGLSALCVLCRHPRIPMPATSRCTV